MPIKTVQDIPDGVVLTCEQELQFQTSFIFMDAESNPLIELAGLDITLRPSSSSPPLYEWTNISAGHGWGPFITDVAIEWVTAKEGWLYPHHQSITEQAKLMWKVYHDSTKRPDVLCEPLTEDELETLRIANWEPELRCLYRKRDSRLIDALKEAGRWDDGK